MKLKKVTSILMMMALSAGMVVPQTVSPLGTMTVYAEEEDVQEESTQEEEAQEESTQEKISVTTDVSEEELLTEGDAGSDTGSEQTAETAVTKVSTEAELTAALASASTDAENPTVIELQNDITCTKYMTVPSKSYVEIRSVQGESYTLQAEGSVSTTEEPAGFYESFGVSGVLCVAGSVVLKNVILDANYLERCAYVKANGTLELGDRAVLTHGQPHFSSWGTNTVYSQGGGVYVAKKGTLIMYKGSQVVDNTTDTGTNDDDSPNGIGVYVTGSTAKFIMYGGTISGNDYVGKFSKVRGGGVSIYNSAKFYMYGGTIKDNNITGVGAGVYFGGTTFVLGRTTDTEIADLSVCDDKAIIENNVIADVDGNGTNAVVPSGAGIYMTGTISKQTLTIQAISDENTVIRGNKVNSVVCEQSGTGNGIASPSGRACGGGIYLGGTKGSVVMTGGTITGNQAVSEVTPQETDEETTVKYHQVSGGGVYVNGSTFTMSGGEISGNSVSSAWTDNELAGLGGGVCVAFDSTTSTGTFQMTGGIIRDNISKRGKDVSLVDKIPQKASGIGDSGEVNIYAASPVFEVKEAAQIGEVYLPAEFTDGYNNTTGKAVLTMTGALTGENVIGVNTESGEIGTVIVENAEDGYALHGDDAKAFFYTGTEENLAIRLDKDQNLSLQNAVEQTSLQEAKAVVTLSQEDQTCTYTGEKQTPKPVVTVGDETLTEGTDYLLSYRDNINAGTATVEVSGIGSYTGELEASFEIAPVDIGTSEDITVDEVAVQPYTGEAATPKLTVKMKENTLVAGTADSEDAYDYSVEYADNVELGVATATITGHGNYTGTKEITFNIVDLDATLVSDWTSLKQAIESAADTTADHPLSIALTADITIESRETTDGMAKLPKNAYIQIIGYDHSITAETGTFASEETSQTGMFIVPSGSELTLSGVTLDGAYQERLLYVEEGGKADVKKDVVLTRGRATDLEYYATHEENVYDDEGNVTGTITVSDYVYDKALVGGQAIWNAGEIYFAGSLQTSITRSNYYGVVYNAGSFMMTDTGIFRNLSISRTGEGGVIYNTGSFTMEGGTITGCTASPGGGESANAVQNIGTFTMEDGSAITENSGPGCAVYNTGDFHMEGGKISENKNNDDTSSCHGTIYIQSGTFTMTGGTIAENEVTSRGGAIYLNGGTVTIDGEDASITGNLAAKTAVNTSGGIGNNVGGGIYMRGGELNLIQGSIDHNEAYYVEGDGIKQSILGTLTCKDGVYSISTNNRGDRYSGLGGGIFVDSGIVNLGAGAVIEENYSPISYASGIFVAEDLIYGDEDQASMMNMSGGAQVIDPIWLTSGKSIHITSPLADNGVVYNVYQQEKDFNLIENGGNPVAVYDNENDFNSQDGAKFAVYPYDATYDFAADQTLTQYSALQKDVDITGTSGIYANFALIDVADLDYAFTDAYTVDEETGTAVYRFNGRARKPEIKATATIVKGEGETQTENTIDATGDVAFDVAGHDGSAGDVTVTVSSDSYHYTGSKELTFRIAPFDFSNQDTANKFDSKVTVGDVTYSCEDAADKSYEPEVTVSARLGSVNETTLVEGTDYEVTYKDNSQTAGGTATVEIQGIGNYTGTMTGTFEIKPQQTLSGSATLTKAINDSAFSLGITSSDKDSKLTYTSSNPDIATVDSTGKVTPKAIGETQITVIASETDASRPVSRTIKLTIKDITGVVKASDGKWYYYDDGKVDTSYTGFASNAKGDWYVEKGKVTFNTSSVIQDTTGALGTKGTWYYVEKSNVKYIDTVAKNSKGWWVIQDGKVNFNYTGFASNSKGDWYIQKGKVTFATTSVIKDTTGALGAKGTWYYVKGSKVTYTNTVAKNSSGWWVIQKGKVNFNYTGFASNSNGDWYAEKGKVTFKTTGVIKDASGALGTKGAWYYVKGSKVTYTNTVAKNSSGWWKITKGKVDFGFTGIASNSYGSWYIQKGKVNFGYTGNVKYSGKTYRIVKGKVQ